MTNTIKKVRITPEIPTNSGRRKGWIKIVESIDRSKDGGYAIRSAPPIPQSG